MATRPFSAKPISSSPGVPSSASGRTQRAAALSNRPLSGCSWTGSSMALLRVPGERRRAAGARVPPPSRSVVLWRVSPGPLASTPSLDGSLLCGSVLHPREQAVIAARADGEDGTVVGELAVRDLRVVAVEANFDAVVVLVRAAAARFAPGADVRHFRKSSNAIDLPDAALNASVKNLPRVEWNGMNPDPRGDSTLSTVSSPSSYSSRLSIHGWSSYRL